MAIWYLNLLQEQEMYTNTMQGNNRIYNESGLPQSEQRFKGWYWCHINKQFYRWDNLPRED